MPTDDGRIYVKSWMPHALQNAAPLLLLHDSLGCVGLWRGFPDALSTRLGRQVIAYDRLGFGQSDARKGHPSPRFIEEEAERVFPHLREALRLDCFALLGHSVGGSMALNIAARHPESCEAVFTLATQAFVEDRTTDGIRQAQQAFEEPAQFARLERYHGEKARWVLDAWTGVWLSPEFADWSLSDVLPKVRCPVLAIHGENDEYGPDRFPKSIAQGVDGASSMLIFKDCGHIPHREQPEPLLNAVAEFLTETTRTPQAAFDAVEEPAAR